LLSRHLLNVEAHRRRPGTSTTASTEDDSHAREQGNEEQRRHAVDVSIHWSQIEEVGRRFFTEERQRLVEDAA
jgi:hypothetical protein